MNFRPSMTKNWPGGRRKAKIGTAWNPYVCDFKRPYTSPEPPKSTDGMATPTEINTSIENN